MYIQTRLNRITGVQKIDVGLTAQLFADNKQKKEKEEKKNETCKLYLLSISGAVALRYRFMVLSIPTELQLQSQLIYIFFYYQIEKEAKQFVNSKREIHRVQLTDTTKKLRMFSRIHQCALRRTRQKKNLEVHRVCIDPSVKKIKLPCCCC